MELTPDEAARLGKELIRLARTGGWIDPDESTDWALLDVINRPQTPGPKAESSSGARPATLVWVS